MTPTMKDSILKAIAYMEDNLTEVLKVKDMAQAAGYSVYHFSRSFNALTGHSPYDYLFRRKLSEAAYDILQEKESLTEIALKYHFENYETFTRGFQRLFHLSPSAFREAGKVHLLQWKRRISDDYIDHLNGHTYKQPYQVKLSEIRMGGKIVNDRHFLDEAGQSLLKMDRSSDYIHFHRDHRHLHEYAFMKGSGVLGKRINESCEVRPEWVSKIVPSADYLLFEYKGSYFQIQHVYTYIFETWLPQAGISTDVPYVYEKINKRENTVKIYIPYVRL